MHGNPTYQGSDQPCGIPRLEFQGLNFLLVLIKSLKFVFRVGSDFLPLNLRVPQAGVQLFACI